MKPTHLSGKKVAKSHSTVIDEARTLLKFANAHPLVKKIVTGEIKQIRSGPPRLKLETVPAGLKAMVRGRNARQQVFIYTDNPEILAEELAKLWDRENRN